MFQQIEFRVSFARIFRNSMCIPFGISKFRFHDRFFTAPRRLRVLRLLGLTYLTGEFILRVLLLRP
jgi:hypothetical protein